MSLLQYIGTGQGCLLSRPRARMAAMQCRVAAPVVSWPIELQRPSTFVAREYPIGVDKHRHGLQPCVTSSWALSARLQLPLVWLAPRMALLHPRPVHASNSLSCSCRRTSLRGFVSYRPTLCSTSHPLPRAHDRRYSAALAGHGPWQRRLCATGGGAFELLASVPPRLGTAAEVAKTLLEDCRFGDLLQRTEEQLLIHRKSGKRKKRDAQPDLLARADRACRTAAVGPHRKATTGLVSSTLSFEEEDRTWTRELLATSTLGEHAYSDPAVDPPPGEDWDRPFASLHHAALMAPGLWHSSGARHGHAWRASAPVFVLARFLPPRDGSHARDSAGNARKMASRHPSIFASSCGRHTPNLGACEGLRHWRGTIEPLAADGTIEKLVASDLDLVNMLSNAEWPRIRLALRTHFPFASAIKPTSSPPSSTGATSATNWGAEQGGVLGTIQSALVLGQAREAHLDAFLSNTIEDKGVCDEWFVDDGQVFARPSSLPPSYEPWMLPLPPSVPPGLCAAHGNVKRSARLLCPPERQHEFQRWDTPYVHDTVDVLAPAAGTTALGSAFGSREHINP